MVHLKFMSNLDPSSISQPPEFLILSSPRTNTGLYWLKIPVNKLVVIFVWTALHITWLSPDQTHIQTHTHKHIHTHTHTNTHTHKHIQTHTHTNINAHTNTHTYKHTHHMYHAYWFICHCTISGLLVWLCCRCCPVRVVKLVFMPLSQGRTEVLTGSAEYVPLGYCWDNEGQFDNKWWCMLVIEIRIGRWSGIY